MKDWKVFVKAGRAKFTVKDLISGKRFTFKVNKHHEKESDLYFVSVLTGTNNDRDYTYLGLLDDNGFRETHRTKVLWRNRKPGDAFDWFYRLSTYLTSDKELPPNVEIYHAGCCGRCGKTLTVPSSIASGFGPECIVTMSGIIYGSNSTKSVYEDNAKELKKLFRMANQLKD